MNKRRFGLIGEKIAQGYLKDKGYEVIGTNFYTKKGEIDIVAKKSNCIVFVEVKTRSNLEYGTPASAVNYVKKRHMRSAAKIFLQLNKIYRCDIRFDVIEVLFWEGKCKINHIEQIM